MAVIRVFSEMLVKWPLYLSQGPAALMWSVVHLPATCEHKRKNANGNVRYGSAYGIREKGIFSHLDENSKLSKVLAIPSRERL